MKKKIQLILSHVSIILSVVLISSCGGEKSAVTGWEYNNSENGGFQVDPYEEQETGPGLVLIEGGTFTMGRVEQDVNYEWDNIPRRITVPSFYMDETEIANIHYLEYLYWLHRVYDAEYPEIYQKALPDTLVWRDKLAFNEPYVELYLRHPAYMDYPVVGVNWLQANDFCAWRTDRVNETILIREGILRVNPNQSGADNFNTDAYLSGQYEGLVKDDMDDLNPASKGGKRKVKMEDGILLPRYRLPTEAEWEYSAYGLIGNTVFERITDRRQYPWNGHMVRNAEEAFKGDMMANFKRGRGDNMGTAGYLNDNADITAPVHAYWPNDYGLFNMGGNVSEWVMDVYRPLTNEDKSDFNSFRGSVFKTQKRQPTGELEEKDSLGHIQWRNVTEQENVDRRNYRSSDNINFLDGDKESSVAYKSYTHFDGNEASYKEDATKAYFSMIDDRARVYKGGSWKDRAYWMSPGTRRFLDERQSTSYIGFRCAMARVGSPVGLGTSKKRQ